MVDPRRRNRQLALFLAGAILLNFPALAVVDGIRLANVVPLTAYYLVGVWLVLIALAALVARLRRG